MSQLSSYTDDGAIRLLDFTDDYRAARHVSDIPLEITSVEALIERAAKIAAEHNLLLPQQETLLERCVVSLLNGHLILQGPPGTGKTTLAHVLAEAFQATSHLETATADWSTYDVIGGLQPGLTPNGAETLVPWLGHVPRAAVRCATTIARHADADEDEEHQAHWLIIDEFSRAEIDKAIGPLYTVLSAESSKEPLSLWFGDADERRVVYLPKRFRIIGTMNTVDTNFVYSFSQGLRRRFQFVYVGVPEESQLQEELDQACRSALQWIRRNYKSLASRAQEFLEHRLMEIVKNLMLDFLRTIRYEDSESSRPGWPIGTAQVLDVIRALLLRIPEGDFDEAAVRDLLDLAFADCLIPQASNLLRNQQTDLEDWIAKTGLSRSHLQLRHLRAAAATGY